jgi:hypothetical protein
MLLYVRERRPSILLDKIGNDAGIDVPEMVGMALRQLVVNTLRRRVAGQQTARLGLPVVYNNDANAAALYAHHTYFGAIEAARRSSVSAIVGTGLGGGVIEAGQVIRGAAGMAGELGHVWIPMDGLLALGQPVPHCNCGLDGDVESVASLTGIANNLLPYWLTRYPEHELARVSPVTTAAKMVRGHGEAGDELALAIFRQQAMAIGALWPRAEGRGCTITSPLPLGRRRLTSFLGIDTSCVVCHVTGSGKSGGFIDLYRTAQLANVQCEACHGSGREHRLNPAAAKMAKAGVETCLVCHTKSNSPEFDFASYWEKIKH